MSIFDFLDKYKIPYTNKDLINQAFVHSSYVNEHKNGMGNNERLELMGDAVLQVYSAQRLYSIEPPLPEGLMSTRRSNLVSEKALAQIVRENNYNRRDYTSYIGARICTFKGQPVTLTISDAANAEANPNELIILRQDIGEYIFTKIFNVINFRYGNDRQQEGDSPRQKVYFL